MPPPAENHDDCITLVFTGVLQSCSLPAGGTMHVTANEDGTCTLRVNVGCRSLGSDDVEKIVAESYERSRLLLQRSLQTVAESINTVTMRYASRVAKYVYDREPSMTESDPSDLEFEASPAKVCTNSAPGTALCSPGTPPARKRIKLEGQTDS